MERGRRGICLSFSRLCCRNRSLCRSRSLRGRKCNVSCWTRSNMWRGSPEPPLHKWGPTQCHDRRRMAPRSLLTEKPILACGEGPPWLCVSDEEISFGFTWGNARHPYVSRGECPPSWVEVLANKVVWPRVLDINYLPPGWMRGTLESEPRCEIGNPYLPLLGLSKAHLGRLYLIHVEIKYGSAPSSFAIYYSYTTDRPIHPYHIMISSNLLYIYCRVIIEIVRVRYNTVRYQSCTWRWYLMVQYGTRFFFIFFLQFVRGWPRLSAYSWQNTVVSTYNMPS